MIGMNDSCLYHCYGIFFTLNIPFYGLSILLSIGWDRNQLIWLDILKFYLIVKLLVRN